MRGTYRAPPPILPRDSTGKGGRMIEDAILLLISMAMFGVVGMIIGGDYHPLRLTILCATLAAVFFLAWGDYPRLLPSGHGVITANRLLDLAVWVAAASGGHAVGLIKSLRDEIARLERDRAHRP